MKLDSTIIAMQRNDGRIVYTESDTLLNARFRNVLLTVLLILLAVVAFGKQNSLQSFTQITDKQVLIQTNTGEQILFNAFTESSIGVKYVGKENICLLNPEEEALSQFDGSMYVEELDELFQITTVNPDGLIVRIDRKTLEIQFIEKGTDNVIYTETPFSKIKLTTKDFLIERHAFLTWTKSSLEEESFNFGG